LPASKTRATVAGDIRYSPCKGVDVRSGLPPFSRNRLAERLVIRSKQGVMDTSGLGSMVMICEEKEVHPKGVIASSRRVACPVVFQVMEARETVGLAIVPYEGGVMDQVYEQGGPLPAGYM